jgi:hypothetical protein
MARKYTGLYVMNIKRSTNTKRVIALLAVHMMLGGSFASVAYAAPAQISAAEAADALGIAEGAWAAIIDGDMGGNGEYDEQIFTELSPLIDTPEGIKLPEDQLLTD